MSDSLIGQTIDGYQIEEVIGRGGMGTVYRAVDVALDKTVALKIISPHLAEDETFLKRFRAEAKALARLDAPGVVRVLTLRETERGVFIVMEYVEGETLSTIVPATRPSTASARCRYSARSCRPSTTPTPRASCTATSSPATSSSPTTGR